jgi:membrane-bound serine protease (ClpP class)
LGYLPAMKTVFFFLLMSLGVLFSQDQKVLGKSEEKSYEGKIVRITVGEKDLSIGASFKFMERTLDRAKDEGAKAVIFDLDTPGGLAFPTKELMSKLANLEMPTITFVNSEASSAGSFIAISTDRIYMTPGSNIGSSAIVNSMGEIDPVMRAKLESFFGSHVRYIAEKKGHRREVIEAMMFLSDEERKVGDVVVKPGGLLSLNSTEATKLMDDGPLLAKAELATLDDVLKAEGWSSDDLVTATPSGFERVAWWVASASGLLIMVGLAGGYFEFKTPGFGIGGIVSIAAFTIFFFGNYFAGNMANYELVAVFVLGLVFIAVEIFVIPGFGVAGITGLLMVVGSLAFSMLDGVEWQKYQLGGSGVSELLIAMSGPATQLAFGIFGSLLLLYLMMKFLPKIKFINDHMLPGSLALGTGMAVDGHFDDRVGMTGVATSDLRPSGKVEIEGKVLEVMTAGEFISKGDAIQILSEDGMGVVVKKVPD